MVRALRSGKLVGADACQPRGTAGAPLDAAHQDYSYERRFDVLWLCRTCYNRWDRE